MEKVDKKNCIVEVFSRVTGFFRPVQDWNPGKKKEFKDRNTYITKRKENKEKSN